MFTNWFDDCPLSSGCSMMIVLLVGMSYRHELNRFSFSLSASESEPTVECSSSLLTTAAGFDANSRCGSLDYIAQTNILIGDESWKAHVVRSAFALFSL